MQRVEQYEINYLAVQTATVWDGSTLFFPTNTGVDKMIGKLVTTCIWHEHQISLLLKGRKKIGSRGFCPLCVETRILNNFFTVNQM